MFPFPKATFDAKFAPKSSGTFVQFVRSIFLRAEEQVSQGGRHSTWKWVAGGRLCCVALARRRAFWNSRKATPRVLTNADDERLVLYRAKKHRDQGQYGQQVRDLAVAVAGRPKLRELETMVSVHYSQLCLEHLNGKTQGPAAKSVVSIVLLEGASPELMSLAQEVCDRGSGDVLVLARHLLDEFCMDCHPGFSVVLRVAL
eukprot:symbB.v1.2.015549.t1/scaffold1164.1/size134582/4